MSRGNVYAVMKNLILLSILFVVKSGYASPITNNSSNSISPRIIGGKLAQSGQFPYLAAIWIRTNDRKLFCSGTLIDSEWILTAGHCVDGAVEFSITMGATNLERHEPERIDVKAQIFYLHPGYNHTTLENDIGLIRLNAPVMYTIDLRPVDLLAESYLQPKSRVIAVGWGSINDHTSEPPVDHLNWVVLETSSNIECQKFYGSYVKNEMVCVGINAKEGTCKGDSGGPLLQHDGFGIIRHVGVSSFISGAGCETSNPSGYTRTYPYLDWISSHTGL